VLRLEARLEMPISDSKWIQFNVQITNIPDLFWLLLRFADYYKACLKIGILDPLFLDPTQAF